MTDSASYSYTHAFSMLQLQTGTLPGPSFLKRCASSRPGGRRLGAQQQRRCLPLRHVESKRSNINALMRGHALSLSSLSSLPVPPSPCLPTPPPLASPALLRRALSSCPVVLSSSLSPSFIQLFRWSGACFASSAHETRTAASPSLPPTHCSMCVLAYVLVRGGREGRLWVRCHFLLTLSDPPFSPCILPPRCVRFLSSSWCSVPCCLLRA